MKKIIRNNLINSVELIQANLSISDNLVNKDCVLVSVQHVGLCRTDLFVANGSIKVPFETLTLGHEFSATVKHDPKNQLIKDSWIGFNPLYGNSFMGLDFDGALAEEIWIPRSGIIPVQENSNLSSPMIAYLEPVAASAAPLKKLSKPSSILIIGTNRIAKLTELILRTSGHFPILCDEKELSTIDDNSFEYVVETILTEDVIGHISRILVPGGTWLLKSRKKTPTPFISMAFIAKEINIQCVNYLDFQQSLLWMENNFQYLDDLLGSIYPIDDWKNAFDEAYTSETKKIFIEVNSQS